MAGNEAEDALVARFRKMSKPVRVVYARPRTFIAILIGVVGFALLPAPLRLVTRALLGWDIFVAAYLLLVYTMMFHCGLARIKRNAVLQDDGRFGAYRYLPDYWVEGDRVPLLVRFEGRLVGFALLNAVTHSGVPADRNMAEFFIARKYRRRGVGLVAARAIFGRYPGLWEVAVARRNTGALAFWRRAIGGYELARGVEEVDLAAADWDGPILRFHAESAGQGA